MSKKTRIWKENLKGENLDRLSEGLKPFPRKDYTKRCVLVMLRNMKKCYRIQKKVQYNLRAEAKQKLIPYAKWLCEDKHEFDWVTPYRMY